MEFIKVSAKTVSDAIMEASIQLETFSDNIEYEVLEHGSSGFLGFGSKRAVIKARIKQEKEVLLKEDEPVKVDPVPVRTYIRENKPVPVETEKKLPIDEEAAEYAAKLFLDSIFKAMEMNVTIDCNFEKETLNVDISGEEMGVLIGKRGQTLDSLQYLISLIVNKEKNSYIRVKLDTENYRNRRKETLENLAKNIAFKVKKTRKPVFLEPMNPYERRIIHSALQNDPYITTHSEGEDPYRKIVVTIKNNKNNKSK